MCIPFRNVDESRFARRVLVHHAAVNVEGLLVSPHLVAECPPDDLASSSPKVGFALPGHQFLPLVIEFQNVLGFEVGIALLCFTERHGVPKSFGKKGAN